MSLRSGKLPFLAAKMSFFTIREEPDCPAFSMSSEVRRNICAPQVSQFENVEDACLLCLRECIFKSLRKSLYGSFLAKLFYFFIFRDVLKSHLLTNRLDHLQEFRDLFFSYQIDL